MKELFDDIYETYHHDLYRFIFYMVKDKETAEDLIQDVYIKILQSYHSYKGKSSLKTWIFSIARHQTIDYFRSNQRKQKHVAQLPDWNERQQHIQDTKPLPEEITVLNEDIKRLYSYLDHCTPNQKSVLLLRYIHDFSIKETANILNFSTSKVKTTQHRALKVLKTLMSEEQRGDEDDIIRR
ncbi:RNA polymerase sigma factor SigX [Lentibacillus saliphilus]|uniref:RNA polymerase sigma factor SigX n=1 Tax=Lentibacillus saliphilus TaxID=2737028 RepID=UPI001C2F28C5|nr:RNA polymerase sigma factor SigX [Lentibacillus saliphilus]